MLGQKRLFLALADAAGHAWMRNLDSMWIDPGRGPRTLVRGGKLHTKYKITLPESFFVGGEG
ncbi:MAG: type IV toxin-antitoxin system AbiEi family antitoxin domain-containing protein [Pseudomonadota bacterium]